MSPLIRESPSLVWDALEEHTAAVSLTPRTGLTVADYGTVTLTIREDPHWPRSGATEAARGRADPIADGWPVVAVATGSVAGGVVTFTFTMDLDAGTDRYSFDAWGTLSTGGGVQLVQSRWVTGGARVVAPV